MRILITGTSSGLGKSLLQLYTDKGFETVSVNREERRLERTPSAQHREEFLDITNLQHVESLLATLKAENQFPDLFILNAGINEQDNVAKFDHETFVKVIRINLFGVSSFVSALQKLNASGICVVNISSTSSIYPNRNNLAYYVSKLALLKAVRFWNEENPQNSYKSVVLGPVRSRFTLQLEHLSPLRRKVFQMLSKDCEQAATAIHRFTASRRSVLYWPKSACVVYLLVNCLSKLNVLPLFKWNRKIKLVV